MCRYYKNFGKCKFRNKCFYLHKETDHDLISNEVKKLFEEIEHLKKKTELIDQLISNINSLEKSFNLFREKHKECTENKNSESEDVLLKQNHQCDFCDFVGKSKSGLKNHMRAKHNSRKNLKVKTQESEIKETVSSTLELLYNCEEVLIFREHCKAQHGSGAQTGIKVMVVNLQQQVMMN